MYLILIEVIHFHRFKAVKHIIIQLSFKSTHTMLTYTKYLIIDVTRNGVVIHKTN